jgi:ribonuclease P protein component
VAYAVGRRAGNAVARNRLRRRLREAVREQAELLEPDTAYLVGADASAATMSFAALSQLLARALAAQEQAR